MKVILLVIDTLRADHLACYGYHRKTSPNLDRLAREGVLFERAYPSDVPTQPSFTSMFTGRRGIHTGIVSHSETETLSESVPYLTEILSNHGVTTAAVSTLYMMRRWFARGFKYYMNPVAGIRRRLQQVDAEEINGMALPWIREHKDEDFFIFIHYWDPHGLYLPPEPYRRMFYQGDESDPENHSLDVLKTQPVWPFTKRHLDAIGEDITDIEYVIAQYDGEIRYADDNVGRLLEHLEDLEILDETAIIFTSDHGESLGEHHFYFDHAEVYETTVHIPLIIRYPQMVPEGKRIDELVQSTICTPPTILTLFGIEPPKVMTGKDLIKIANGQDKGYDEVYVNQGLWTAKRAIITEEWKLIETLDKAFWETPDTELYDMKSDPKEKANLAEEKPDVVEQLQLRMYKWLRENLRKHIDPLELIVSRGLPAYEWIRRAAEREGYAKSYEEWRMRVDRGEKRPTS
ncbi:MAG: sulfatase [Candidatus Bathyarchaeia archaeon]